MHDSPVSRRSFLIGVAAAAAASGCATRSEGSVPVETAVVPPAHAPAPGVLAQRVVGPVRVAGVGVGGQGMADLGEISGAPNAQMVALCDVDAQRLATAQTRWPQAAGYRDWRQMLRESADTFDAVIVSTPDHMHVSIAVAAMELGKHVYVQKPLAQNLAELRLLVDTAARTGAITQMGTQCHSSSAYRTGVAMLRAGAIGRVSKVHSWVGKGWGRAEPRPAKSDPVPDYLLWDLWLGVAPERPYVEGLYHPMEWRRWQDFGTGTLGDMGCHLLDPVFSGLGLGAPISVVSHGAPHSAEGYTLAGDVTLGFAETGYTAPEFTLHWSDGEDGKRVDRKLAQMPGDAKLPGAGSIFIGEEGTMVLPHWDQPRFYKGGAVRDIPIDKQPEGNHYHEFIAACRGEAEASTPFSYSGLVTEAVLTGVVAGYFPNQPLAWDHAALRFDLDAANAKVQRAYRDGWRIPALG